MLRFPVVSDNQRTDVIDFNRLATGGLANLAQALGAAFLPQPGALIRGGRVKPTTPASKAVIVEPAIGIDGAGNLLLSESEVTLAVPNNVSGNPRIDLVSVGYVVTDRPTELRDFWNETTETDFTAPTVAEREAAGVPTLTVGTPASSPVAPALPAGHIALATVAVAAGFTSITEVNIDRVSAAGPLSAVTWQGDGVLNALPLTVSAHELRVTTPAGGLTLLYGQVHIVSVNSFVPAVLHKPLVVEIEEVGVGIVGSAAYYVEQGGHRTVAVGAVVAGPKTPGVYRLRFSQAVNADGLAWGGIMMIPDIDAGFPTRNFLAGVTL